MKRNFILPPDERQITSALLGPTNTGKTHHALSRLTGYNNGIIGFPLRLLARENYDRLIAEKGFNAVALVTGEEKIIPAYARYFICTVEAMPVERSFDFLAIDEIQLCGDAERGHIFTDRLLRARGKYETMFLGSETIRPILQQLIPNIHIETRERLSELVYTGHQKLSRLPKRSAVVAFSMDEVYAHAEMMRRHRGGTAIVLGALSPRARNAQVEMYQSGEVNFMVATDAIGMGLNMDINHVALAASRKFDGVRARPLRITEIAQIAGRAGRARRDGSYGTTGPVRELEGETTEAIRIHSFEPLKALNWRNHDLNFSSPKALLKSLEIPSGSPLLVRGRTSDDHQTLSALIDYPEILECASTPDRTRLLWDVCQIPDFRKTLSDTHQSLIASIFMKLLDGPIPDQWVRHQVMPLENMTGDVDTLMMRLSHIRTWTYIAHRPAWLDNPDQWQDITRRIEDMLSDALHTALTNRFVDRRSAILVRALEDHGALLAGIRHNGDVIVEGEKIGQLEGFRFIPDETILGQDRKAVMSAARSALKEEIQRRMSDILKAEPKQFRLLEDGQICYQANPTNPLPGYPVGLIKKGTGLYSPEVQLQETELLQDQDKSRVAEYIQNALKIHIQEVLEPLTKLNTESEELPPQARGIAHQLYERLGVVPRIELEELISGLEPEARRQLRALGVRLGPLLVYLPAISKPAAVRLRAQLWYVWQEKQLPAPLPRDGSVSQPIDAHNIDTEYQEVIGYPVYGPRMIRADMMDRVVCEIYDHAREGKFQAQHKWAEWIGCTIAELVAILSALGHKKIYDPAEQELAESSQDPADQAKKAAAGEDNIQEVGPALQAPSDAEQTQENAKPVGNPATPQYPAAVTKPELATFLLKRGRATEAKRIPHRNKSQAKKSRKEPPKNKREKTQLQSAPPKSIEDSPFAVLKDFKIEDKK